MELFLVVMFLLLAVVGKEFTLMGFQCFSFVVGSLMNSDVENSNIDEDLELLHVDPYAYVVATSVRWVGILGFISLIGHSHVQ